MVLTMVYNTQNYWVLGLFPSAGIENTTFRKLDLFPSSDEGGGEDTYSVGPLKRANLNHWFVCVTETPSGKMSNLHSDEF
jgi:phage terminase large subunit-like protein